ncbi:MAG: transporter substrate-binding domain-containing protein [Scytonematopsis contorta HA4267-MV1]|jgi:polar amino acid transport system substrate-binding protein|nr:transporter substrate-binding domain-containing protein [Scytonematopsis contorta HA4267-MV1]
MVCTRKQIIVSLLTFTFYLLPFAFLSLPCLAVELSDIQQRGHFKIAVKDNLRPLAFKDINGNLQGLEIDLAQRLAQDLLGKANSGKENSGKTNLVKFKPVTNRDRISQVLDNKVDFTIARVTATASRARLVNFSIPYYLDGTVIVTKNTSLQKFSDFTKLKIAVLEASSTISRIKYFIPTAELVGVNSYQQALELLEKNGADGFAADASVLAGWVQQYRQYRLLSTPLSTEPLSVVIPKGLQHDELRRKINEAIAGYLESGWLKERAKHWGLPTFDLTLDLTQ